MMASDSPKKPMDGAQPASNNAAFYKTQLRSNKRSFPDIGVAGYEGGV